MARLRLVVVWCCLVCFLSRFRLFPRVVLRLCVRLLVVGVFGVGFGVRVRDWGAWVGGGVVAGWWGRWRERVRVLVSGVGVKGVGVWVA